MGYASKYYDPVKAHEYYEQHKKLTGRTSTKGMSDSQKEMAAYVKEQLKTEKKEKDTEISERHKSQAKNMREYLTNECKEKVARIKEHMKSMSPEEKAQLKEQISALRQSYSDQKKQATSVHSTQRKYEKEINKKDYQNKYMQALTEIRNRK